MPRSLDIIALVLILIPGLIGYGLFSALTPTRQPSWTARFVVAIVLSIFSYTGLSLISSITTVIPPPANFTDRINSDNIGALFGLKSITVVTLVTICSLVLSLVLVVFHNSQLLHRVASWAHLTAKTGFSSNWDDVFWTYRKNNWILVQLDDGTALSGWVELHSDVSDERSILLSHVRQFDSEGESFAWNFEEMAFFSDLDKVKFLRFIPESEVLDESEE